ncbi:MAG: DUF5074 domain-containing protein [Bacteroidales bacterium]|nr:DUF5074 domain-containing protein [Bacteroidales bacterium]MBD5234908.1 DUF5074 domain-containing protein [Barnesiella sp.]
MNRSLSILSILLTATASAVAAQEADYTRGIIWVNEDWYGHQNSTVNYLMPDDPEGNFWKYRIIQAENPGKELGCTNQYGAIWNDRIYLIAKQDKDPGATITGGRITVADAKTMKILHQQSLIDPSGSQCDGRGFNGVDEHKGYISTSNGVWIFDLDSYTVTGQVEGSANPNAGGDNDKPNTDPTGSLYHGQSGMMVSAAGKIFVAHQQYGLMIVDPAEDKVVNVISMDIVQDGAGIGSVVKSKDGALWISVAKNCQGTGVALNYIVRLDPVTLDYEIIPVKDGFYAPANSWYAWTPDAFVASSVQNCLYWKGGPNRWFTGTKIYKFDCDTREQTLFIDLEEEGANWKLYGCAIGVHPETDELYMALYHEFGTPTYITRRYSPQGEKIRDYEMIMNYWFPSLPLFPEGCSQSGIHNNLSDSLSSIGNLYSINGIIVKRNIEYGDWPDISPGIYIWKSGDSTRKILIR